MWQRILKSKTAFIAGTMMGLAFSEEEKTASLRHSIASNRKYVWQSVSYTPEWPNLKSFGLYRDLWSMLGTAVCRRFGNEPKFQGLKRMPESTVFIVDDDPAVSDSISALVRCLRLRGEPHTSAESFLASIDPSKSGCVVADIHMPGMSGIELQDQLIRRSLSIPIIFITGNGDIPTSVRAIKAGAVEFFEKPVRPQQLTESILNAIQSDSIRRQAEARGQAARQALDSLTDSERAVLNGLVAAKINKVIAAELDVSLRTVQLRRASIMKKLAVNSPAALIELVGSAASS